MQTGVHSTRILQVRNIEVKLSDGNLQRVRGVGQVKTRTGLGNED
jgi:hypothetical protein